MCNSTVNRCRCTWAGDDHGPGPAPHCAGRGFWAGMTAPRVGRMPAALVLTHPDQVPATTGEARPWAPGRAGTPIGPPPRGPRRPLPWTAQASRSRRPRSQRVWPGPPASRSAPLRQSCQPVVRSFVAASFDAVSRGRAGRRRATGLATRPHFERRWSSRGRPARAHRTVVFDDARLAGARDRPSDGELADQESWNLAS